MHLHISGMQTLINVLGVIAVLGTLNLVVQHVEKNPSKFAPLNTLAASYDALINNH